MSLQKEKMSDEELYILAQWIYDYYEGKKL